MSIYTQVGQSLAVRKTVGIGPVQFIPHGLAGIGNLSGQLECQPLERALETNKHLDMRCLAEPAV